MKTQRLTQIVIGGVAAVGLTFGFTSPLQAAEGDSLWSQTFGGDSGDVAFSIVEAGDGGYLLAGATQPTGVGYSDVWIIKLDGNGQSDWSKTFGGPLTDGAYGMTKTSDGYFLIVGMTYYLIGGTCDAWLIKMNSQGDTLWTHSYGGASNDAALSVLETHEGNYLLTGFTVSDITGDYNIWVAKTDTTGDTLWTRSLGGAGDENAYFAIETSDYYFLLTGRTEPEGSSIGDMWLVKLDSLGNTVWTRTYGGSFDESAESVVETSTGEYLLTGYTDIGSSGPEFDDAWLLKLETDGDTIWTQTYGGGSSDNCTCIIKTSDGNYLLVGKTESFGSPESNMWLIKVNSYGDTLFTRTYGGSNQDWAMSVIENSDGNYLLAGATSSYGAGQYDMWLVRVEGSPTPVKPPSASPTTEFRLFPPSPNPCNPSTVLSYELRIPSSVKLEVFDLAGRLVTVLLDTWQAAGNHRVTFDGSALTSGIYLARLTAGEFAQTQKLVLLK